ncbi:MAG: hypothetical protein AB1567_12225 [bacterium]
MENGKVKITYDKDKNEITIMADANGLRYLSDICLSIIGEVTPAGHWHLMKSMGNLEEGSIDTIIMYSEDL